MQDRSDVLLDVDNLSVSYGVGGDAVTAVRNVSFVLRRGDVLGIAGESGSGKSTLALAVTRLLQGSAITAGSATWHGSLRGPVDLVSADPATLREIRWAEISIVFQSAMHSLNPVLSVGTQIDDVIRAHDHSLGRTARRERVGELLRMVGIPADRAHAYPHELSGGMRQRATIAIALALSPQLVVLDEPTTALDVVMQRQVLREIDALRHKLGFAMIFITHDLSLLLEIADEILVMYAGTIVERATSAELYREPLHPYSFGLLRSFPNLQGERKELMGVPGSPPNLSDRPTGCAFHPRCHRAMPTCSDSEPVLLERQLPHGARREVACHLYDPAVVEVYAGDRPTEVGH